MVSFLELTTLFCAGDSTVATAFVTSRAVFAVIFSVAKHCGRYTFPILAFKCKILNCSGSNVGSKRCYRYFFIAVVAAVVNTVP